MLVTLGFKLLFQAQSPGHYPKWSDRLKSVKIKGKNDAKEIR